MRLQRHQVSLHPHLDMEMHHASRGRHGFLIGGVTRSSARLPATAERRDAHHTPSRIRRDNMALVSRAARRRLNKISGCVAEKSGEKALTAEGCYAEARADKHGRLSRVDFPRMIPVSLAGGSTVSVSRMQSACLDQAFHRGTSEGLFW